MRHRRRDRFVRLWIPAAGSDYLVIGHENLGEIVEVGGGVSKFKVGDLVVPSVRRPCEQEGCLPCRSGRQDFCATGEFTERGIKMRHGFLTEFYTEAETYLTPVPPELRDVAVLAEPLTVAEKALAQVWEIQRRLPWVTSKDPSKPGAGLRAVVLGAGLVGILGAMALISRGFETRVITVAKAEQEGRVVESLAPIYISSTTKTPGKWR